MSDHDLSICLVLKAIHTLDAGTHVELKFVVSHPCGDVDSGDLLLRLTPAGAQPYLLGDRIFLHLRGEP